MTTSSPLVTAILVFSDTRLIELARAAVSAFQTQTYTQRELVVVNQSGTPLESADPRITELGVRGFSAGAAFNLAMRAGRGDWFARWDADQWSHPERLGFQLAHRAEAGCVLLRKQLRVMVRLVEAHMVGFVRDEPEGCLDSLVWSRGSGEFRDTDLWHDSLFLVDSRGGKVVIDNTGEPGPGYQTVFYHGLNSDTQEDFLGHDSGSNAAPSEPQVTLLQSVLQGYGIPVGPGGFTQ